VRIKGGVELQGVHPFLWIAAGMWDYLRQAYGYGEGTITGGREGPDAFGPATMARRSGTDGHAQGTALDFRTNDLPGGPQGSVTRGLAQTLQDALGDEFRVVVEVDHVHVVLRLPAGLV
jgi:hypothetical protein